LLPYYYFRKQFTLTSADFEEFLLSATCTDVSVAAYYPLHIYLNGTLVPTFLDTVTIQGNEIRYFDLTPFIPLLHVGTNTVAVQLGNYWSDFDNVAFDLSLKAVRHQPGLAPYLGWQSAGQHALSVTAPPGIWQLQSCDSLATDAWQVMQTFTNAAAVTQVISDTGQNGRPLPAEVRSRFYRLVPF
jgi:hypothetical protein